jgi:hypothetical protein
MKIRPRWNFNSPKVSGRIACPAMDPANKPTQPNKTSENDDDLDEPLGERQPEANDAIVCEGGCQ